MKKKSHWVFLLLAIMGLLVTTPASALTPAGEFTLAVGSLETEVFGPTMGTMNCKWYQTLLFDSLVGIEPPSKELSTKTGIAERWEHTPDFKIWTFYIRKEVTFHNGDKLTGEDVKFSLDRALSPVGMSVNKATLTGAVEKIELVDPYTVRIHCKKPVSLLPLYLSEQIGTEAMIVPKKYIEEKGDQYFRAHPIGTGPCKLAKHIPGEYMLFETIDRHWAFGVPRFKHVKLTVVPETMARIGLLERGDVDMILLPRERAGEVRKRGFPVVEDPAQGVNLLFMTETWKKEHPTSDIRVRKALNLAIDRKAIHETLFGGLGRLAPYSFATAAAIGYEPADSPYPYDSEGAKALLKEAGYSPDKPCVITLYSFPVGAFPEAGQVVEVAASYWTEVGFKVNIEKVPEWGMVKKKIKSKTTKGAIYPGNIGGRVWALPITNVLNHSKTSYSHAEIPELDKAIDEAMAEIDPDKMESLAHATFMTMYKNYLHVALVDAPGVFAINPKTVPDAKEWEMGVTTYDFNLEWVIFH